MMSTSTHPKIAEGIIWRRLEDNAVIVTPESGKVRVFNEVGALIWQMLANEKSLLDIQVKITTEYEVSEAQATADINQFLADLRAFGLII